MGFESDPCLVNAGGGGTLGDPCLLQTLDAYKLQESSPLIEAGLDIQSLFGIDTGSEDYYGTPIPVGVEYDVGAHEFRNIADFDYDHNVTCSDYARLASGWKRSAGQAGYDDIYDLHDNDTIDTNDVRIFTDEWLWRR